MLAPYCPFIGGKPLHGPLALQVNLEHCLELSSHNLLMYLGCYPPKCSMPEETRGEQLD